MLCQRCSSLIRATRPRAATATQAPKKALESFFSSKPAALTPTSHRLPRPPKYHQPRRAAYHTSNSLSRPAEPDSSSPPPPPPTTSPTKPEKPDFLDAAESQIWDRLVDEFDPAELLVQDVSGGCGSMYGIEISSEKFRGANLLKQQRMVNAVLGDLMKGWHGVQLKTRVPS